MKRGGKLLVLILILILIVGSVASYFTYYTVVIKPQNEEKKPAPFTTLLEMDGEVNFEVTCENGPANEVCIAVNPKNPKNLIAGGKDYTLGPREGQEGYRVWSGYYWSKDGGKTWGNGLMGFPNVENNYLGYYDEISDPVVAFANDGTAYYSGLAMSYEPKQVMEFPRPKMVQNGIYVAKSTDGGETYSQISFVIESPNNDIFHDKQWFTVDPYDPSNIYVTWTSIERIRGPGGTSQLARGRVVFSRSTDGGLSWEPPRDISRWFDAPRQSSGSIPAVGPDGTIYVTWIEHNINSLMLSVSYDKGITWPVFSEPIMDVECLPRYMGENEYRTPTIPSMAVDRSNADTAGNVYIVWSDYCRGNADILLIRSEDGGNTWSEPIMINDDPYDGVADQFFPWISVSPIGDVHVVFYDKREDPDNYLLDVYYTHSEDGENFDKNWKITTNSSDPVHSYHQATYETVFIGDYIGIDSSENYAYAIWTDTRKGEADAYSAVIVGNTHFKEDG
jgi:hypothetical protein